MRRPTRLVLLPLLTILAACGEKPAATPANGGTSAAAPAPSDLTPWQLQHGIGPITTPVTLAAVDTKEAHEGKELFDQKCGACHKPNERYVGPALGGVVDRRGPEYVMNMALNPAEMVRRHPEAKKLYATFLVEMPNQGLTPEQARRVVEYLRTLPAPPAK
jgi:mono/diheme cytochrome c family protein